MLVVLTAAAAIAGPNLAAPPAPWLFLFRVLIVLLGLGLVGYLLMDGRLTLPAGLPRPAGLLAVWFGWTALSIGWADDVVAALRWTLFLAMLGGLAIAIALVCRSPRRARILLWTLFGVFVLACLIAVAEVVTGLHLPTFRQGREGRTGLIGVGSLFGNQNNFATFLSLSLPYLLVLPIVYRDARLQAARLHRRRRGPAVHPGHRQQVRPRRRRPRDPRPAGARGQRPPGARAADRGRRRRRRWPCCWSCRRCSAAVR